MADKIIQCESLEGMADKVIQCESLPTMTQTDKTEEETREDSIQVIPCEG